MAGGFTEKEQLGWPLNGEVLLPYFLFEEKVPKRTCEIETRRHGSRQARLRAVSVRSCESNVGSDRNRNAEFDLPSHSPLSISQALAPIDRQTTTENQGNRKNFGSPERIKVVNCRRTVGI